MLVPAEQDNIEEWWYDYQIQNCQEAKNDINQYAHAKIKPLQECQQVLVRKNNRGCFYYPIEYLAAQILVIEQRKDNQIKWLNEEIFRLQDKITKDMTKRYSKLPPCEICGQEIERPSALCVDHEVGEAKNG